VTRGWCCPVGVGTLSCMRLPSASRRTTSLRRRVALVTALGVAAGSAASAGAQVSGAEVSDAVAAPGRVVAAPDDAAPVPARTPVRAGELMSYVLNAAPGTAGTAQAATAARSAGATRTIAVAEGTPGTDRVLPRPKTGGGDPLGRLYVGPRRDVVKDPREAEQWDMKQIKADRAHQVSDGSREVVVGVLDSGVDSTHPDLKANLDPKSSVSCVDAGRPDTTPGAADPTNSTHGTHVAGTVAAARNGVGIVGVAPGVRLASVKVVNDAGSIYPEYAICGFMWAGMRKFDVTNNSYFVDPWQFWCDDQADQKAVAVAVGRAVAWSRKQGVVSAAAAGNSGLDLAKKTVDTESPNDSTPVSRPIGQRCHDLPTELPGVVTVSSTTRAVARSSFSNFGAKIIDVAAPGSDVLSTVTGGGYGLLSGTSMASPHVAGVLALLKSKHPAATPEELVTLLRGQAQDTACPKPAGGCTGSAADNGYFGDGVVDAKGAVTARVSGR
jgi:subtilisin family serine protease